MVMKAIAGTTLVASVGITHRRRYVHRSLSIVEATSREGKGESDI